MKTKTNASHTTHTSHSQTNNPRVSEVTDKAMKNFEQALRTGVKLQEEAAHYWTSILNHTATAQDWQKQVTNMSQVANGFMPAAQKQMEGVLGLLEKNTRTGAELVKKAVDAVQTPNLAESQTKWLDFYTSSLGAVRSTTEALTEINTQAIDSCISFLRNTQNRMGRTTTTTAS